MHIFLTGATGYIGGAVADALKAAGHAVHGLARSEEAAGRLRQLGCEVEAGSLSDSVLLGKAARRADGVIHAGFAWGPEGPATDETAVHAMLDGLQGTGKPFIYTSGAWVMGDTRGRVAAELAPLLPAELVAWRPAVERLVLDASGRKVRSIVIRPVVVYGRGGGMIAKFVESARERGAARFVGDGENHWSFIHVEDLAALYVSALEKSGPGELFLASEGAAVRVREVAEAASRAAGADGCTESWPLEEARQRLGVYADALVLDQRIASTKAARLLGWIPKRPSVLKELSRGSYGNV